MAIEIFGNNAQCTLNGAINAVQVNITVNPPSNPGWLFPPTGNFRILIDNEILLVTAVAGLVWTVVRGVEAGTDPAAVPAPHANGALVSQVETSGGLIQAIVDRVVWTVSAGIASAAITMSAEVVFSNANNVSFGLNGSTITASAGPTGAANINLSAGTTSNLSSAFTFSNSNNVSFGLNNGTITASASFPAGVASINLSAGTTSNLASAFTFSNSNNVSFGLNASTITASVATSLTNINFSAGTTSNNLSAVTFSNFNNVSFGLNGSVVTASASFAAGGASINLSAGTTSNLASAFTFSNSNGVSFGLNASTITASIATSLTAINVSAGTTSNNLSAITFSNSNNVSFGLNGSTMTASASFATTGIVGTVSVFSQDADFVTNFTALQASLSLQKLSLPMNLRATQLAFIAAFGGASNASGAVTVSHAVYTLSNGTASLASSGSRAFSWTSGSATTDSNQYGGASGTRYRSVAANYSMPPGDYLFGWWVSTAGVATVRVFGRAAMNLVGTYDGVETSAFVNGLSVSSVVAFPNSIAATDTGYARTGFSALAQPGAILLGT